MGVQWPEESKYLREMRRWDTPKRLGGENRDGFERFPMMLYMAQENPLSHKYEVAVARDVLSLDKLTVLLDAQQFNTSCQMVVNDEAELERAKSAGWRETQQEAIDYHAGTIDRLAAEALKRARTDSTLSEAAQKEAAEFEATTPKHVGEIPEKPRVRKPVSPEVTAKRVAAMAAARAAKRAKKEAGIAEPV